jgi:hypothetical protein
MLSEKQREYQRKYRTEHQEKSRERHREWRAANPEKARETLRKAKRKCRYGITSEEYDALMVVQDGRCAICGRGDEDLSVDHSHSTGIIRGLLCRLCNAGIGFLQDNPDLTQKATDYLRGDGGGV